MIFLGIAEINFLIKVIFKHKMYYTASKNSEFGRKLQGKPKSPRETIFPTLSAREFGSGAHNSRGHMIPCNTGNIPDRLNSDSVEQNRNGSTDIAQSKHVNDSSKHTSSDVLVAAANENIAKSNEKIQTDLKKTFSQKPYPDIHFKEVHLKIKDNQCCECEKVFS